MPESPSNVVQTVRGIWKEIDAGERQILERTTLADLLQRMNESDAMSYQI
jgi:DNA-binding IscR family transcriptional regulator